MQISGRWTGKASTLSGRGRSSMMRCLQLQANGVNHRNPQVHQVHLRCLARRPEQAWRVPLVQPGKPWLALSDLTHGGNPTFPPLPPQPPDEYRLSLGKITDILRLDYQEFFQRKPDFGIYDPAVVLQLRKPWSEPKQMAGCKQTYVGIVKAIRTFCKSFLHDGTVDCQVCDGRPYGCDLRVHWTCKGQLKIGTSVTISAISLYTLKHCNDVTEDELAWRVHSHIVDVTEIRPSSLRQQLKQLMNTEALSSA